jgi:HAD superfamily hydrolase (TIGR01490 family)
MTQKTAFFDFDDTLIRGDSIVLWNQFLFSKKPQLKWRVIFIWWALLLWLTRRIDTLGFKAYVLSASCEVSDTERQILTQEFVKDYIPRFIQKEALEKWKWHKSQGHLMILLSASGEFYLKEIGQWLEADYTQGTLVEFPSNKSTALFRRPLMKLGNFKGPNKAQLIEEHPEWTSGESWAYSDHIVDCPMLEKAQTIIAVNPENRLRIKAQKENWEILEISNISHSFWEQKKMGRFIQMILPLPLKASSL